MIGAGATILGNVKVGEGAKVGAGSVVLIDVPPRTMAVGNPARLVGGKEKPSKHDDVPGESTDHTSFISEWSDYTLRCMASLMCSPKNSYFLPLITMLTTKK